MALSFVYLAFVALLRLLIRCGRTVDVKDIELLVLRHQLEVLRRQVERPKLHAGDRALLAAAARLPPPARRQGLLVTPHTLLRWHRELVRRRWTYPPATPGRPPVDARAGELSKLGLSVSPSTFAGCSRAPAWDRRRGARDLRGASSCARRPRASSRVTSSPSKPRCCGATTCCYSSSFRPAASTSQARPPTRMASGSPSRPATSACPARSRTSGS